MRWTDLRMQDSGLTPHLFCETTMITLDLGRQKWTGGANSGTESSSFRTAPSHDPTGWYSAGQ